MTFALTPPPLLPRTRPFLLCHSSTCVQQHFTTPILQGRKKGASKGDVEMMTGRLKELSVIRDKMVLRRTKVGIPLCGAKNIIKTELKLILKGNTVPQGRC